MSHRHAVITGIGMLSPLDLDVPSSWEGIFAGHSRTAPIEHMDLSAYSTYLGGSIRDFNVRGYLSTKKARRFGLFIQYGLATNSQAARSSGLEVTDANREHVGVSMGFGIGGLTNIENNCQSLFEQGPRRISPLFMLGSIINMVSGFLSTHLGLQRPNYALTTACTTGTHSISMATRNIAYDEANVMAVGGSEMTACDLGLGGSDATRVLSTHNGEPIRINRPWDRDRDGLVLSDGFGALVLEELEHVRARDARIYAELIGFSMNGDVSHMIVPPEDDAGAIHCMKNALRDADLDPRQVDYINAHGTSALVGDVAKIAAVKSMFDEHAHALSISSTRSTTGHLLGIVGTMEVISGALALHDQVAPSTINLDNPDGGYDLGLVAHETKSRRIDVALSNSLGFDGTNGTLVFRRFTD